MSAADKYLGPWMRPETLARLPKLRRSFDMNRDPLIRLQLLDEQKSEAQRREESTGSGGSGIAGKEKPIMAHRPPPAMRGGVDRAAFSQKWLKAQRDAALAIARPKQTRREPEITSRLIPRGPSR